MEKEKVSIIIPTHNYGHLIQETIEIILKQSYQNWEAIIIDDGSTDATEEIIAPFLKRDSRLTYLKQGNKGVSAARNLGIKASTGKYIQLLDADDLISHNKIKNQIRYFQINPNVDVCLVKAFYFESNHSDLLFSDLSLKNESAMAEIKGSGLSIISAFTHKNQVVIHSPLFRRKMIEHIGFFNEEMNYLEDWDFWYRCASKNYQFGFINDEHSTALVRVHAVSASKKSNYIFEAEARLRKNIANYILQNDFLSNKEKTNLIALNRNLLIQTYKNLMAKISFFDAKTWKSYYKQIDNFLLFSICVIKSINIKRKLRK